MEIQAYAVIKHKEGSFIMDKQIAVLGRHKKVQNVQTNNPCDDECFESSSLKQENINYFEVSNSRKVSKEAIKIYVNTDTREFHLVNMNKNTILIGGKPLKMGQETILFHKTLIQISADTNLFFMLPEEIL